MKFLFDASSVLQLIRCSKEDKALRILAENCILDLTKYEIGNALWKEQMLHGAIGEEELSEFLDLLRSVVLRTKILTVDAERLSEVAGVAARERITFYDASYITVAKIHSLTLVSEDRELVKAASKHARTSSSTGISPS